jgi:hypothetical protein
MPIVWSKDQIEALSTGEILALQENAQERGRLEISSICDQVLSTRSHIRRSSRTRSASSTKILEADCGKQLSEFAIYLSSKYDLSAKTASMKSLGVKGFKSHQVTAKNGQAKLGGHQRTGRVAFDRYISYRIGNEPVSLTALLISKESDDGLVWQVLGHRHHFPNFHSYSQLRPYATDSESGLYEGGEEFVDFSSASSLFEQILMRLAPLVTK